MNILAFYAHPDDETMLSGGTLALLSRQGARVFYLSATRGEGGDLGEPPLCTRGEAGAVRSAELACAVESLGGGSLSFLRYVDPLVGPGDALYPFTDDEKQLSVEIADFIRLNAIDAVLTHGSNGEYGHPAHRLVHRAARGAVDALGSSAPLLYTVQAAFDGHPRPRLMNPDDPADLVLDISPVKAQKIQAALCHRTQNPLFVRRQSQEAGRLLTVPEVIVTIESLHRVHPPRETGWPDPLAELLYQSGCVLNGKG
jgi:LmbE family N-acetylglucosaminyl deacetylase